MKPRDFYNLSNIAFLGGSIVNHGGTKSIWRPLVWVIILLMDTNIGNFTEIYDYLKTNKISYTTSNDFKNERYSFIKNK